MLVWFQDGCAYSSIFHHRTGIAQTQCICSPVERVMEIWWNRKTYHHCVGLSSCEWATLALLSDKNILSSSAAHVWLYREVISNIQWVVLKIICRGQGTTTGTSENCGFAYHSQLNKLITKHYMVAVTAETSLTNTFCFLSPGADHSFTIYFNTKTNCFQR